MYGNFAAHAGVIANNASISPNVITPTLTWNFNDVLVMDFSPPGTQNLNDRPRINIWRDINGTPDLSYLKFISGGRDMLSPAPSGIIYQPWGDRRTGTITFPTTSIDQGIIVGIDLFTHPFATPINLSPPLNEWIIDSTGVSGEIKYQYRFKTGVKFPQVNIELAYNPSCLPINIPSCNLEQIIAYSGTGVNGCPRFGCADPTTYDPTGNPPDVSINCVELSPVVMKGYAFYRHDPNNRGCNVPGIGTLSARCVSGHVCDRTNFLPRLVFGDGNIVNANKQINLNNLSSYPNGPFDREDTFEFTIPNTIPLTGQQINLNLQCQSPGNDCHIGVTYIVMTITTGINQTTLIFDNCVAPGVLTKVPVVCQPGTAAFIGIESGSLYNNNTWINGASVGGFGSWNFISGTGSLRNISNSTQNGRTGIGNQAFYMVGHSGTGFVSAHTGTFTLTNNLASGQSISVDTNYSWNKGTRNVSLITGLNAEQFLYRVQHSNNDTLRVLRASTPEFNSINQQIVANAFNRAYTYKLTNYGTGLGFEVREYNTSNIIYFNLLTGNGINYDMVRGLSFITSLDNVQPVDWFNYGMFFNNVKFSSGLRF
jgi:hypothetical protein